MNNLELDGLKYFLMCYFNQTYKFDDLKKLSKDFLQNETKTTLKELILDLKKIQEMDDWQNVEDFVREHGMRKLDEKKLKKMVEIILAELIEDNLQ